MIELVPESYVLPLDPDKIFRRRAPLQVDLGCGDGSFLCALAERMPEKNFLGIERLAGRVRSAAGKGAKVANVRVLRVETDYAVRHLLPACSVEVFHLLFPDPWPKRRHHRRRIVTPDFLNAVSAALAENGILRIVTDQADYFELIVGHAAQNENLSRTKLNGFDFPQSTFEKRFQSAGAPIYRLELRKTSPVT